MAMAKSGVAGIAIPSKPFDHLQSTGKRMSHAHIVHSPADLDALFKVHEALRMAGVPDWYDPEGGTGPDAQEKLKDAFCLVVLVSKDSMRSDTVKREIKAAKRAGLPILPFRVDGTRFTTWFKTEIVPLLRHNIDEQGGLPKFAELVRQRYKRRCPVISVMNLKGGVGKTTVTAQVSGSWQNRTGGRVLLIDFDPQYNLTQTFISMDQADRRSGIDCSVISLFEKSTLHYGNAPSPAEDWSILSVEPFNPAKPEKIAMPILTEEDQNGRLDLITGQFEISKYAFAQDAFALEKVKSNFLRTIDELRGAYDLILLDTNPNATFLTRCALEAADRVLAPMHPDIYSLRGVRLLSKVVRDQVGEEMRPDLSVLFNAVGRSEQSEFEADARNGVHDAKAGFKLSKTLLTHALPKSGHMAVRGPEDEDEANEPWRALLSHHGRGGGLGAIRKSLDAVSLELTQLMEAEHT